MGLGPGLEVALGEPVAELGDGVPVGEWLQGEGVGVEDLDLDGSDSLQAVRAHRAIDPLAAPGRADLTSHVAFRPLLQAITETGLHAFGPLPQGDFLRRLGIELRLRHLLAGADAEMVTSVRAGVDRLIDETAMGMLFKVIAASDAATPPAGFTADEEWT